MSEAEPFIIDVTAANFEREVIEQSKRRPVVIDFWAPWCGPCRQLGPMLESLAREGAGRFVLAKINIDEQPQLAALFRVQSIPLVIAFRDGKPVNEFLGVLPETELRQWLETVVPGPEQQLLEEGRQLEDSDPQAAEGKFREALALAPDNDAVRIELARVLLKLGREDECRDILQQLESRGFLEPEAERIKSELELRSQAEEAGGVEEARKAVEADPDNPELKLKLADALAVAHRHREALEICLQLVQQDRDGIGQEAKQTMLKIFDMLGPHSALVSEYRRKLATALY